MPRTRKIVMTVFCFEEDAEEVAAELFNEDSSEDSFFLGSNCPLANIKVDILKPTTEEDRQACEDLDEDLDVDFDPSDWTIADCIGHIRCYFGQDILHAALLEISSDDVEGWRNEVRRRRGDL